LATIIVVGVFGFALSLYLYLHSIKRIAVVMDHPFFPCQESLV